MKLILGILNNDYGPVLKQITLDPKRTYIIHEGKVREVPDDPEIIHPSHTRIGTFLCVNPIESLPEVTQ